MNFEVKFSEQNRSFKTEFGEVQTIHGKDGKDGYTPIKGVDYFDGKDGVTPHIGANGNWYTGETDTGVKAQGDGYVLTDADKSEIATDVTEQVAPVSYNPQTLTGAQKAQARKNIGCMSDEVTSHSGSVEFNFKENITVQLINCQTIGRLCVFCLQFVVNTQIESNYGFTFATLPFSPTARLWINNGTKFYMDGGSKDIRVNGSAIATGSQILSGLFFTSE